MDGVRGEASRAAWPWTMSFADERRGLSAAVPVDDGACAEGGIVI